MFKLIAPCCSNGSQARDNADFVFVHSFWIFFFFFPNISDWTPPRYLFTAVLSWWFNEIQCVHCKWISKNKTQKLHAVVATKRRYYNDSMSRFVSSVSFLSRSPSEIDICGMKFFFRSFFHFALLIIQQSQHQQTILCHAISKDEMETSAVNENERRCRVTNEYGQTC